MNHIIKISFIKDVKVYLYRPDTSIMNIFTLSLLACILVIYGPILDR